jgi:hypothetical protein
MKARERVQQILNQVAHRILEERLELEAKARKEGMQVAVRCRQLAQEQKERTDG